ncbi:MAG: hypothetical protein ACR5LB_12965 [Wolbachia sp.]
MLGKIREFCGTIYSEIRNKVKNSYAPMVEESFFDNTTSKPSEKKSEEHLILLNNKVKQEQSGTAATEWFSGNLSTQNVPQSTPERGRVELESDE